MLSEYGMSEYLCEAGSWCLCGLVVVRCAGRPRAALLLHQRFLRTMHSTCLGNRAPLKAVHAVVAVVEMMHLYLIMCRCFLSREYRAVTALVLK